MNQHDDHLPVSGQQIRNYPSTNQVLGAIPSGNNLAHHDADPVLTEMRAAMTRASEPSADTADQGPGAHHEDPVLADIRARIARHESGGMNTPEGSPVAEDHEDPVLADIRAKMAEMVQRPANPSQLALGPTDRTERSATSGISLPRQKNLQPQISRDRPSKTVSKVHSALKMKPSAKQAKDEEATKPDSPAIAESESKFPDEMEDFVPIAPEELRPLPPPSATPVKSILKRSTGTAQEPNQQRRLSVQDQTNFNTLITKVDNLEEVLASTDHGLIDTSLDAHKKIVENVARKVLEDPPIYALRALYQEFVPCLRKINKHYHQIAVGTSAEHPSLKDCDARLKLAEEQLAKMNDLI
ncbi:hypothetical protein RvY_15823 [Ramazzottius varieornatus]|uniref:Uncharacterized protein n=1 Tax=Ramazzottius varieornatus TaxID=947166 RepID=A0A1D1VWA4_RAMVA|nr:hypothetical protein RvY_15823 [Ramazzottius varieornatus]